MPGDRDPPWAVGGPEHIGVVGNPWRSRGRLIVGEQAPAAFVGCVGGVGASPPARSSWATCWIALCFSLQANYINARWRRSRQPVNLPSRSTPKKCLSETSRMAAVNSTPRASRSRFGCTASSSPNSERPTSATRAAASAQHSGCGIFRRYGEAFLCSRRGSGEQPRMVRYAYNSWRDRHLPECRAARARRALRACLTVQNRQAAPEASSLRARTLQR